LIDREIWTADAEMGLAFVRRSPEKERVARSPVARGHWSSSDGAWHQ
jgi:hypothetical protein